MKCSSSRPSGLPHKHGSYHLRERPRGRNELTKPVYRVDSQLIGISVIDILPSCISSVYFIWQPDWAWASLGKLSALKEASLALKMHRSGLDQLRWVYMGQCQ